MQSIRIVATGGTFALTFTVPDVEGVVSEITTARLAFDITAEELAEQLELILNPNNEFNFLPFTAKSC